MADLYKRIALDSGLTVNLFDHTIRYYGDFHLVKLELVCEIDLADMSGKISVSGEELARFLGESVRYHRFLEKTGVPGTEIERAKERLVADFEHHSLAYFSKQSFPEKLVLAELRKARQRLGLTPSRN